MSEHCSNCGNLCCGKLQIEIRKNCYYFFCRGCFNLFMPLKNSLLQTIFRNNDNFVTL